MNDTVNYTDFNSRSRCLHCGFESDDYSTYAAHSCSNKSKFTAPSILTEAEAIINGPRRDAYGPVEESFGKIAEGWSVVFGVKVTPRQVAHAMIWLKVCRDLNKSGRDNLVDIAGYAGLAGRLGV